jgi:hypothetical protein
MLTSCPVSMLNQIKLASGIPFDSFLSHRSLDQLDGAFDVAAMV